MKSSSPTKTWSPFLGTSASKAGWVCWGAVDMSLVKWVAGQDKGEAEVLTVSHMT